MASDESSSAHVLSGGVREVLRLREDAKAGQTRIKVDYLLNPQGKLKMRLNADAETEEAVTITTEKVCMPLCSGRIGLTKPLQRDHAAGEVLRYERIFEARGFNNPYLAFIPWDQRKACCYGAPPPCCCVCVAPTLTLGLVPVEQLETAVKKRLGCVTHCCSQPNAYPDKHGCCTKCCAGTCKDSQSCECCDQCNEVLCAPCALCSADCEGPACGPGGWCCGPEGACGVTCCGPEGLMCGPKAKCCGPEGCVKCECCGDFDFRLCGPNGCCHMAECQCCGPKCKACGPTGLCCGPQGKCCGPQGKCCGPLAPCKLDMCGCGDGECCGPDWRCCDERGVCKLKCGGCEGRDCKLGLECFEGRCCEPGGTCAGCCPPDAWCKPGGCCQPGGACGCIGAKCDPLCGCRVMGCKFMCCHVTCVKCPKACPDMCCTPEKLVTSTEGGVDIDSDTGVTFAPSLTEMQRT